MGTKNSTFLILGGIFLVLMALFILTGGNLGGKKTVENDQDLPPVASGSGSGDR